MLPFLVALLGVVYASETVQPATPEVDVMTMNQDTRCKQVLVTCLINGQPMRMMLDTGATHTVLHEESAEKLKNVRWIDTSKMNFRGNSAQRPKLLVADLLAGPAESTGHHFLVMNLGAVRSMMTEKIDGILGMDILGAVPFTFDLRKMEFYWGTPEVAKLVPMNVVPDGTGRVIVQGKCGSRIVQMLLDTGSSVTRVLTDHWEPGAGEEIRAQMGDIDNSSGVKVMTGKPGDIELGAGVAARGVTPLLITNDGPPMLGMDGLRGVVLVHVPAENSRSGLFLLAQ